MQGTGKEIDLCHKCRKKQGYKPRDSGVHTAVLRICDDCGEKKSVLPGRHWVEPDHAKPME